MKHSCIVLTALALMILASCNFNDKHQSPDLPKGKLFIIGGGKRPASMVKEMIRLAKTSSNGHILILPMASSEPDTSAWYADKQFRDQGFDQIFSWNIQDTSACNDSCISLITTASMIYITGGDQQKFMKTILGSRVHKAIIQAFSNGAVIAGTSAGAAVMSEKMITGNEFKHPEYTGDFRTIEAENMELTAGLGLLKSAIIDQHFIWRMRMNRLITVALENPGFLCIGIDEATALIVEENQARVFGESQVILLEFNGQAHANKEGLIGGRGLRLDVLLPGELFDHKFFDQNVVPFN